MESIIVTGGTGFIGRNLIRRLSNDNCRVYAIIRPESRNLDLLPKRDNVIPVFLSLDHYPDEPHALPEICDAFYHFAWAGVNREELNDPVLQKENINRSMNALRLAEKLEAKCFVFAGSRSEYGVQSGAYSEDNECDPLVAYGKAKLEFGMMAQEYCAGKMMKYIHPRIFSVYGPDDHPWSLIYTSVSKMLRNEAMDLSACTQLWNFMEIRDAVDLLLTFYRKVELIPAKESCFYNVATNDIRPLKEYVEEIKEVTNSLSQLNYGAYKQSKESAVSLIPDMTKVERVFGWEPKIPFAEGIRNMVLNMENDNE